MVQEIKPITLGGRMYPKFNTVAIIVGGDYSGKENIRTDMLMVEGLVFRDDELMKLAMKSEIIKKRLLTYWDVDVDHLNISDPDDYKILYDAIIEWMDIDTNRKASIANHIRGAVPKHKPNLIIENSVRDRLSFKNSTMSMSALNYNIDDVHLILMVGDIKVAQNRVSRGVEDIEHEWLNQSHERVAKFMSDIFTDKFDIRKYADGDVWLVFDVDNAIQVKKSGQPLDKTKIDYQVIKTILERIPETTPLKFA